MNQFTEGEIILIDKPLTWTSFNVVKKISSLIKKYYKIKNIKVGHAGTLDPLATGLLIVCTGKKTKEISGIQESEKEYIATIELGKSTRSFDCETEVDNFFPVGHITLDLIKTVLPQFIGQTFQEPPVFSAKKYNGKRAYKYARLGQEVNLKPSPVKISSIEIIRFSLPTLVIRITCSKGTYIRALARDIGIALNSGAYLKGLVRTKTGNYYLDNALSIEEFEESLKVSKQIV